MSEFIERGVKDELGSFVLKSITIQPLTKDSSKVPEFWSDIVLFSSKHCGCLVVSLCGQVDGVHMYKSDLFLTSEDMNMNYFHKKLCNCMIKDRTVIYIDVSNLTIRGSERLLGMLRDAKKLFDSRIKIILITGGESRNCLPKQMSDYVDLSLDLISHKKDLLEPPRKKNKTDTLQLKNNTDNLLAKEIENLKLKLKEAAEKETMLNSTNLELKKSNEIFIKTSEKEVKNLNLKLEEVSELEKITSSSNLTLKKENQVLNKEIEHHEKTKNESEDKIVELNLKIESLHNEVNILRSQSSKKNTAPENIQVPETRLEEHKETKSVKNHGEENDNIVHEDASESSEDTADSVINTEVVKQMKLKVSETEKMFANAGPTEILHRSFKNFHYAVQFSTKLAASDDFCCTVEVKSGECLFDHFKKSLLNGKGRSKALAKADAMLNLLKNIKKD